ncbi:MAG: hypothetical protein H6R16_1187 [Proteobacteria bacterium]|nr:hypothetical protein [Pseudomonadota bacterium]
MNTWLARGRFALAYPQWLPLAGGLLVLIAAGLHLILLPGRETRIEAGERQLQQTERAGRRARIDRQLAQATPEQARLSLLERFPDEARLHAELGRLLELADQKGLQLSAGEYRLLAGKDKLFDRYVLNLPVQGSYRDLRAYLTTIRSEFPALAIEDVTLRRENIGASAIDAQLRLVIFFRHQGAR